MAAVKKLISWLWPQRLSVTQGELSPVLEIAVENGKKVLNAGTVNYSYGALHEVFRIALHRANITNPPPADALILGFGAGSIATILTEELKFSELSITGIEADATVIRIAKESFGLDRFKNLQLLHTRAETYVESCTQPFDLIAVDVFVESQVPESCRSEVFLQRIYNLLRPGGTIVFNTMPVVPFSGNDPFRERFFRLFPHAQAHEILLGGDEPNRVFSVKKV